MIWFHPRIGYFYGWHTVTIFLGSGGDLEARYKTVTKWLDETMPGQWFPDSVELDTVRNGIAVSFTFYRDTDAVHFKLRWA